jgi:hypothetical protein
MLNPKALCVIVMTALTFSLACESKTTTSPSQAAKTQTAAAVSSEPIPDLPDYPGGTRTAYTTSSNSAEGFSKSVKAELATSDSLDQIIDFYKLDNLSRQGWKPTGVKTTSASADESAVAIGLAKGTSSANVEISQKGKGNILITLERKDK